MGIAIKKKDMVRTERLILKPFSDSDTDIIAALLADPEITRTFMVPSYETREEYAALAEKLIAFSAPEDTVHFICGIYLPAEEPYSQDTLIGFIDDCGIDGDTVEIGYVINPVHKGQGYASEAVSAAIEELRDMGFKTVKAGYFEGNNASRRVMEKCGMHRTDEQNSEEYRGEIHRCFYCEINF